MEANLMGVTEQICVSFRVDELRFTDQMQLFSTLYRKLGFAEAISDDARQAIDKHWMLMHEAATSKSRDKRA